MWHFVFTNILLGLITLSATIQGQGWAEESFFEQPCGALLSANLSADPFLLKNYDQSGNIARDFRSSVDGWPAGSTDSVGVLPGCTVTICDDVYFGGHCEAVSFDGKNRIDEDFQVRSVNCTCQRNCSCDDITLLPDDFNRVYVDSDCNTCDSPYEIIINTLSKYILDTSSAVVLRPGCAALFEDNTIASGTIYKYQYDQLVRDSYEHVRLNCTDDTVTSYHAIDNQEPDMIELPTVADDALKLFSQTRNSTASIHPSTEASIASLNSKRNYRTATMLLIGGWFSLIQGPYLHIRTCPSTICDWRFPVIMKKLGISNAEYRIITANGHELFGFRDDYKRWLRTLDEYISNDDGLQDKLPNVVVVAHFLGDESIDQEDSEFRRKLKILNTLQHRVVDKNYSNVVFILHWYDTENGQYLEDRMTAFEAVINSTVKLPRPLSFVMNVINVGDQKLYNGYKFNQYGEYVPRNFYEVMKRVCEKGNDPFGQAVFQAALQGGGMIYKNGTLVEQELLPPEKII